MEFLGFVLIGVSGWLVWRRPERERIAFRLLIAAAVLMVFLYLVGTRGAVLPGFNY